MTPDEFKKLLSSLPYLPEKQQATAVEIFQSVDAASQEKMIGFYQQQHKDFINITTSFKHKVEEERNTFIKEVRKIID